MMEFGEQGSLGRVLGQADEGGVDVSPLMLITLAM